MAHLASLTDEQRKALAMRDVSVALSAGAGCGKTHVLTQRFLSQLGPAKDGEGGTARLHQLVAITFTDAAAREMRTRIRTACYQRLNEKSIPEDEADEWLRLLRLIDTARISTIHSFCTSLLRMHAVSAGLDPAFGVLDQGEADVLASEVIDDVLRERLAEQDDLTLDLAAAFGLARLKQQLQTLLRTRRAIDWQTWLGRTAEEIASAWRAFYADTAWPESLRAIAAAAPIDELIAQLAEVEPPASKPDFIAARARLLALLPELKSGTIDEERLAEVVRLARVQGICSPKDWPSKEDYSRYSKTCQLLRDTIEKHRPAPFVDEAALEAARAGLDLLRLAEAVAERDAAAKQRLGKLDFDDLLMKAHALVTDPEQAAIRQQISSDVRLVLVDEFQDTDRVQVELIQALCGPNFGAGRLFFVGDFKQSIYRFRGAQPDVFRDLRAAIPQRGRLPLTENFRSQPAILRFVNALFADAFGDDYEPLRPHRDQITAEPAVEFLWAVSEGKNSMIKGAADAARRLEADWIARRLRALVDGAGDEKPIVDKQTGEPRPVRPGDVAILFRALSDVQVYEEALRRYGLEYYLVGGHAYYAQQEIFDVLNLLRAVASAADEISLVGVLRSPFFSLEDETLFWLAEGGSHPESTRQGAGSINAGLLSERLPRELSEAERAKVISAAATMRHLRAIKDRVPIAELLQEALTRTGYDAVLLAEFLGPRKLANLQKLVERARVADQGGTLELDGFITQLGQFIAHQPKEALAATAAETADVIRLMTIHQAKGLEFPLVVIPDLDRPPKLSPPLAAVDEVLGPAVSFPSDDEREDATTGMTLLAARERAAELDERTRLLYVAGTRAADYLILSSSVEATDAPKSDWMKRLAVRFDLATGALMGTPPRGDGAPSVRVTLAEPAIAGTPAGPSRGPDLVAMIDAAREMIGEGQAIVPPHVGPIAADRAARRQFSFSRLTGRLIRFDERRITDDTAMGEDGALALDPRGLGTLVHDVLSRIGTDGKASELVAWCEHLAPHHVDAHEADAARSAREMIERLVASPRGRHIARAIEVHRELEFLLTWEHRNSHPERARQGATQRAPGREQGVSPRYLRGFIDCLYRDGDGAWRVVDYKTNDVSPKACEREAEQYRMQLYVYAMAAERSLGVSPVELIVYFLRPGEERTIAWDDDARNRAVEMVNDAIGELI